MNSIKRGIPEHFNFFNGWGLCKNACFAREDHQILIIITFLIIIFYHIFKGISKLLNLLYLLPVCRIHASMLEKVKGGVHSKTRKGWLH